MRERPYGAYHHADNHCREQTEGGGHDARKLLPLGTHFGAHFSLLVQALWLVGRSA
jgi:hypothetical protein